MKDGVPELSSFFAKMKTACIWSTRGFFLYGLFLRPTSLMLMEKRSSFLGARPRPRRSRTRLVTGGASVGSFVTGWAMVLCREGVWGHFSSHSVSVALGQMNDLSFSSWCSIVSDFVQYYVHHRNLVTRFPCTLHAYTQLQRSLVGWSVSLSMVVGCMSTHMCVGNQYIAPVLQRRNSRWTADMPPISY